jgi:histidyl-tRNA synthetase
MNPVMALSTQPYKGARDFYPEDKRLQKYMFSHMRDIAERFGYEEYDAPILESLDLYLAKSSQEIVDEQTYVFTDRGGRNVVIRPEMTPTVSRMIAAKRQELPYPMRLYSIPNLWRYERPQKGRLREHWQLNVDVFGVDGVEAEHEIIMVADQIIKSYGARRDEYTIQLNSRKLTEELFGSYLGLNETQMGTIIRLIDRMKKIPFESFIAQADAILTSTQREKGVLDSLQMLLKVRKLDHLPAGLENHSSVKDLLVLMNLLEDSRVSNVRFDITLMRGFDYYTDIVFEMVDSDPDNNRSMFGGGRYNGLVGLFGVDPIATVGFGMGDVTLQNFLESHNLLPNLHPETDAYVILIGDKTYDKAQHAISSLREMGLNIAVDLTGRKLDKQIKSAVKKGIHYAIFIGGDEIANDQYKLRNLVDGSEEAHSLQRIVSIAKDRRHIGERPLEQLQDDEDILDL